MKKLILSILLGIVLYSYSFAQQKPYGYRNESGLFSKTILIPDGYVLDSIKYSSGPFVPHRFIYDEKGKLKRDIGIRYYTDVVRKDGRLVMVYMPETRDFHYNTRGDVDTIEYGVILPDSGFLKLDSAGLKFNYSEDGKIISETRYGAGGISYFKKYWYDPSGNLIKTIERPSRLYSDTIYSFLKYDLKNRLIEKITHEHSGRDSAYTQETYKYDDSSGNILIKNKRISITISGDYVHTDTSYLGRDSLIFNGSDRLSGYCNWNGNRINPALYKCSYDQNEKLKEIEYYNYFYYGAEENLDSLHLQLTNVSIFTEAVLIDSYGNKIDAWDGNSLKMRFYYSKKTFTGIQSNSSDVKTFSLFQNYPNPFNPETVISYQLPVSGHVELKVYDILGKEIATLVNEQKTQGLHEVKFSAGSIGGGKQLTSGIYFYQIVSRDFIQTKKMLLIK